MKKTAAWILCVCLFGLLPPAHTERELPPGKQLNILFDEMITDYQIGFQTFAFEQKLLAEESPQGRLMILEEKLEELLHIIEGLNTERVYLVQQLEDQIMTKEEFAVEMQKLAVKMTGVAYSLNILGEKITETLAMLSEDLRERAETLLETFHDVTDALSDMTRKLCQEMRKQGFKPPEMQGVSEIQESGRTKRSSGSSQTQETEDDSDKSKPSKTPGPPKPPQKSKPPKTPGEP